MTRSSRKAAKKPVAYDLEFLTKIFDAIPDPVFVKDSRHRWIFGNAAFSRMLGRPASFYIGKSDYDVFPPEIADVFWKKDNEIFESGVPNENEELIVTAEGETRTILTKKTPVETSEGRILVGVIRDVTEDRAKSRVLLHSAQMVTLGEIATGLAHYLNNPLTILKGRVDQIQRHLKDGAIDPAALARIADSMQVACDRATQVVMEFRRLTSPSRQRAHTRIELHALLKSITTVFQPRFDSLGVRFRIEADREIVVLGVDQELQRVLLTLTQYCFNAVFETEVRELVWELRQEQGTVILRIRDSALDRSGKEPSLQSFNSTAHPDQTSVGISLIETIVAAHGGTLSTRGEGKWRFEIRLPEAGADAAAA